MTHICSVYEIKIKDEFIEENFEIKSKFYPLNSRMHGAAITTCFTNLNGEMWVTNMEYESQVNFCPFCGKKADITVGLE